MFWFVNAFTSEVVYDDSKKMKIFSYCWITLFKERNRYASWLCAFSPMDRALFLQLCHVGYYEKKNKRNVLNWGILLPSPYWFCLQIKREYWCGMGKSMPPIQAISVEVKIVCEKTKQQRINWVP